MTLELDDTRWAQLVVRDAGARFIIAVKSTGIYCRPGCPARTPLRRNVELHPDAGSARAAGFRACRRCKPDDIAGP